MDFRIEKAPNLECVAKVLNINKGHNEELAERSKLLKGYGHFIYLVREVLELLESGMSLDAVKKKLGYNADKASKRAKTRRK